MPVDIALPLIAPDDLVATMAANLAGADFAVLTDTVKRTMIKGQQVFSDLKPSLALISKIAAGGTPNPQEVVAAMGATVAALNPLAGAAVFACGELAIGIENATESLFHSLGLISEPAKPIPRRGGLALTDPIPHGPLLTNGDANPRWALWDSFVAVLEVQQGGPYKGMAVSFLFQHILGGGPQVDQGGAAMGQLLYLLARHGELPGKIGPGVRNAFEAWFFPMLKKDIEHWWNANPYVPPRDLFRAAVATWNGRHEPSPSVLYELPPKGQENGGNNWGSFILGSGGDLSGGGHEWDSLTVNLGAPLAPPQMPAPLTKLHLALPPAVVAASKAAALAASSRASAGDVAAARASAQAAASANAASSRASAGDVAAARASAQAAASANAAAHAVAVHFPATATAPAGSVRIDKATGTVTVVPRTAPKSSSSMRTMWWGAAAVVAALLVANGRGPT